MTQLEQNPANGTVGPSEWLDIFLPVTFSQSNWSSFGTVFAQWANEKNFTSLIALYETANAPGTDNTYANYLAVLCRERQGSQSWDDVRTQNWRIFSKALIFTWGNAWYNGPCQYWSQKVTKTVPVHGTKTGNILLIAETLDALTSFHGSLVVRQLFPGARLIAVLGGIADSNGLNGNECVDNSIAEYLQSGIVPPRKDGNVADVECAPQAEPVPSAL